MKLKQEKIIYPVQSSIKAVKFSVQNLEMPFHFHSEFEIVYIYKGNGLRYIGDSIQKFKAGDLILVGKDLAHVWLNSDNPSTDTKAFVLQFPHDLFTSFIDKPEFISINHLFEQAQFGIKFKGDLTSLIPVFESLITTTGIQRLNILLTLLDGLAHQKEIELLNDQNFIPQNKNIDKRINAVHQYVQSFYQQKITINDAASIANMEKSAFCRFFKEKTQKTFVSFLNEKRIDQSCNLLLENHLTIDQIAYDCGFLNRANFYRQFKKITGQTPAEYKIRI